MVSAAKVSIEDVSLTEHQVSKQFMSDPMTSFALPYAHRVRRICYPPQLDPFTDDIIPIEKKSILALEHLHCIYFHLSLLGFFFFLCIYRAQASGLFGSTKGRFSR